VFEAASGHATAPPSAAMNSGRLIHHFVRQPIALGGYVLAGVGGLPISFAVQEAAPGPISEATVAGCGVWLPMVYLSPLRAADRR
jgi:hypothetical protein